MNKSVMAYSALTSQVTTKSTFRIIPAGLFKASDGRPGNGSWLLTQSIAETMIRRASSTVEDYPIDYEHQTIKTADNGAPAPAAGWFKQLEWREDGLYVTDARWTDRAKAMIDRHEYRFVSPVFTYDRATFALKNLHSIALTNTPALASLTDLASLSGHMESSSSQPLDQVAAADIARCFGLSVEQLLESSPGRHADVEDSEHSKEALLKFVSSIQSTY